MLHEAKPFIECATYLKANGAKNVIIMVTHAIFYGDTIQLIEKSCIDHVITSNSVNFQDHLKDASKVLFHTKGTADKKTIFRAVYIAVLFI